MRERENRSRGWGWCGVAEMKVSDLNRKEGMQGGRGVRGDKGMATSA